MGSSFFVYNFDVASPGEMRLLSSLGIKGQQMIYANPVKTVEGIQLAGWIKNRDIPL